MENDKSIKGLLHQRYLTGISVALAVCAFAQKNAGDSLLVDKIGFAATIASLILAVLAIVYSMIENSKNQESAAKILEASSLIQASSKESKESVEDVRSATEDLRSVMEKIMPKIDGFQEHFDRKFENFMNIQKNVFESKDVKASGTSVPESSISDLVMGAPPALVILLKALERSFGAKKAIKRKSYAEIVYLKNSNLMAPGYFSASLAIFKLLGLVVLEENDESILVKNISAAIVKAVDVKISALKKESSGETKAWIETSLKTIHDLIG